METFFFLNYGGPGGCWLTSRDEKYLNLLSECMDAYIGGRKHYKYVELYLMGLQCRVHSFGIHRALSVQLPSIDASDKQLSLFDTLHKMAKEICLLDYKILSHNCVTGVAKLLHAIDPNLVRDPDLKMPWSLDKEVSQYCGFYCKETTAGVFIQKYQDKVKSKGVESPFWSRRNIYHLKDLVVAFEVGGDELTKKSLIELGWIIETKRATFETGPNAPCDFKNAFDAYYEEQRKIAEIQNQYQDYAREDTKPEEERFIFGTNHDIDIIIKNLKQVANHPEYSRAAQQTLKKFDPTYQDELLGLARRPCP